MADSAAPRALLVVSHPRRTSLTARAAARARARLRRDGYEVDVLDLYAEGFDPRMPAEDEPDWNDPGKPYSADAETHMRRVQAADVIVVVFPVWWFGLPAMLKGWIDRVWNHGFAYGTRPHRLTGKRMTWIGLAGYPEDHFTSAGWDKLLTQSLGQGISAFCGIPDATVHLIYDTIPSPAADLPEADAMDASDASDALDALDAAVTGADFLDAGGADADGADVGGADVYGFGVFVRRVLAEVDVALSTGNQVAPLDGLLLK
ncbi:NAD(P)H oxidoreductase [Nonomuraea sp. SBT364]|uniref:NAD(P)H oxidoreductase n=1 Tax=Nonomuraea sp. SBT364 TaxID=1580530 RepID=UPI0007C868B1|nr:NAD(P)H oxidoreductase [Nonomuraea sp. SBT364]